MTVERQVWRTQHGLQMVIACTAVLGGTATVFALLAGGAWVSAWPDAPASVAAGMRIIAAPAALLVAGAVVWRGRFAWSPYRVALWIEEHAPELRYGLVTAVDPRYAPVMAPLMEPVLARVDTGPFVWHAAARLAAPAMLAFVAAGATFFAVPTTWRNQSHSARLFGSRPVGASATRNRLSPLTGTLTPPAYSGIAMQRLTEPTVIAGLVGSRVTLTGTGAPEGIEITVVAAPSHENRNVPVDDSVNERPADRSTPTVGYPQFGAAMGAFGRIRGDSNMSEVTHMEFGAESVTTAPANPIVRRPARRPSAPSAPSAAPVPPALPAVTRVARLAVASGGTGWLTTLTLSDSTPAMLTLVDRQYRRAVIIDPRVDRPPTARLLLPAHDSTLRTVEGTLALSATFTDDIGLDTARFEYIKCRSGSSDEDFTCTSGTFATHAFHHATAGAWSAAVPVASLGLSAGDQLSVRAVAWDHNVLTGPGKGSSDTRTIRIARPSEYTHPNVPSVPPSADTALVTLRMLIQAVEQLAHHRPIMARKRFQDSSAALAAVGAVVQTTIASIIDEQTGDGEAPVDPLLALARDSMADAVTDLRVAEPSPSLPPLRAAAAALKRFATVAKYYLRGVVVEPPVNVERVRLAGATSGVATPRAPRLVSDVARRQYLRDYTRAVEQLGTAPNDALTALTLLQVETLRPLPDVARVIGDAVTAVRAKTSPDRALWRARELLSGGMPSLDSLPRWSAPW